MTAKERRGASERKQRRERAYASGSSVSMMER